MITYTIRHRSGVTETGIDTYDAAVARVRQTYTDAHVGHRGDIAAGGDRTHCWPSKELAFGDDGAHACCYILVKM